jgi:hypothetical protein
VSLLLPDPRPLVAPLVESRPEARRWGGEPVLRPDSAQPALDLRPPGDPLVLALAPDPPAPAPGLPDARAWSVALAVTLLEVVSDRRPTAQLSRWLTEAALLSFTARLPRRRSRPGSTPPPPALQSVRLQQPRSGVAEVSVHGRLGPRSVVIALRLEAQHERWMCTALELGPLP